MLPELLYEIYKYLPIDAYVTLRDLGLKQLTYLVEAFRDPFEAKLIYFNGEPRKDLMRGVEYIARTNPIYSWNDDFDELWVLIEWVSMKGYLELVKLLLTDQRVDPSVNNNDTIGLAAENGHQEVVKLLMGDPRVNPADDNNYAIREATINGHLEVVKLLLTDPRVDPTVDDNCTILYAVKRGYLEIVRHLFQDKRVRLSLRPSLKEKIERMIKNDSIYNYIHFSLYSGNGKEISPAVQGRVYRQGLSMGHIY